MANIEASQMAELTPAAAAALLRSTSATLAAELGALSLAQLSWRPAPEAWCINEVVGHLLEAERRGFAGRIRTILAHERPELATWDQPGVARARHDCERDGHALLDEFLQARAESAGMVEALLPEQLDRLGYHPQVGELRVRGLLHEWIFHDRTHIAQIYDTVKALMWPWMGNSRRFSQPQA
jgi:hypothetical protein